MGEQDEIECYVCNETPNVHPGHVAAACCHIACPACLSHFATRACGVCRAVWEARPEILTLGDARAPVKAVIEAVGSTRVVTGAVVYNPGKPAKRVRLASGCSTRSEEFDEELARVDERGVAKWVVMDPPRDMDKSVALMADRMSAPGARVAKMSVRDGVMLLLVREGDGPARLMNDDILINVVRLPRFGRKTLLRVRRNGKDRFDLEAAPSAGGSVVAVMATLTAVGPALAQVTPADLMPMDQTQGPRMRPPPELLRVLRMME